MAWLLPEIRVCGPDTVSQFTVRYHLAIPSPPEGERAAVRAEALASSEEARAEMMRGKASLSLKREEPRQRHPAAHQHLDQGRPKEHEPEGASRSQETREQESAREQGRDKKPERRQRGPGVVGGAFGPDVFDQGDQRSDGHGGNDHAERQPERAVRPEEEKGGGGGREGGGDEDRQEEEAISEVVHGRVRLPVRPARGSDVDGDDYVG